MRRTNWGFTVIELLLVIAIILVILTLTLPAVMTVKRKALILSCQSNMHQISLAMMVYRDNYNGAIPPCLFASEGTIDPEHVDDLESDSWGLAAVLNNTDILKCPADIGYGGADYGLESGEVTCFASLGHSYAFNNSAYTDPTSPYDMLRRPARFADVEREKKPKDIIMLTDFSSVWHGAPGGNTQESKYYLNIMYFDGSVEGKEFSSDQEAKRFRNDVTRRRWWEVPPE